MAPGLRTGAYPAVTGVFRRKSRLPDRADEAEAVVVAGVAVDVAPAAVGAEAEAARDGTVRGVVLPTAATFYPVTAGKQVRFYYAGKYRI